MPAAPPLPSAAWIGGNAVKPFGAARRIPRTTEGILLYRDPVYFASAGHLESALLINSSAFGVHIGRVSRPGSR